MPDSLVRSFYAEQDRGSARPAAMIREQFLVPFFCALGWTDNFPAFPVLVLDEGGQAQPDMIQNLMRDAFSAAMSVAVVTNFAWMEIYDLSPPPLPGSAPPIPVHITAGEYAERWPELVACLSPFGWPARGMRPGLIAVLGDLIAGWRLVLGRSLCREYHFLSDEDLNLSVQRTIDLLLLLWILHERGYLIQFNPLQDRDETDLQHHLISQAAAFIDPVRITPPFWPGDEAVLEVMRVLTSPACPVSFGQVSPESLAVAFDAVLRILLVADGSRMTSRPNRLITAVDGAAEVPDRMLRTVAEVALLPLLKGRSRVEQTALRVVDPCCGTGRLLIVTCRLLLSAAHTPAETLSIVSGIEQDPCQAEVAALLLVLTTLDHAPLSAGSEVTPAIWRGNPLVGSDFLGDPLACLLSGRRLRRLAPFDWSTFPVPDRGFDAVLTSVPVAMTRLFLGEDTYLPGHYSTFQTGGDRSICLVERMMPMIAAGGALTILFSDRWLHGDRSGLFRAWLTGQRLHLVAEIPALPLVGTDNHLCLLKVGPGEPAPTVAAAILEGSTLPDSAGALVRETHLFPVADLSTQGWVLEDRRYATLIERLTAEGRPLDDLLFGGIVDGEAVPNQFPAGQRRQLIRWDRRIRPLCRPVVTVDRPYTLPVREGYCIPDPGRTLPERVDRQLRRGGVIITGNGQDPLFCQGQKILCSTRTGVCTFDEDGTGILGPDTVALITSDLFLLGLLNSTIGGGLLTGQHPGTGGDQMLNADLVSRVRVRVPDCYDPVEQGLHDQVVTLVGRLLGLYSQSAPAGLAEPLIERVDWCICTLYGVSDEEIAVLKR
ncbi:hypothetical protein [Methanosphaerula palustris]|uniref:DNA methylase adenine-specific domain-containing protein n=1 Tax=Methanosphaerula palustris (strain ATCC BAA-1556 / DSM 19958 / E1-9c) TaxID=521011 RepID=B8GGT9_METPE|nr:hypothetical protein [Methanosphaerula palustris]ACL16344.1 hypothetical protein Mpal_0993 [Methanosphaerula palustris E1-9c]